MKHESKTGLNDEELFERFKTQGDAKAFKELYDRYSRKVFAYCLRACEEKEAAKDVFQQIMSAIVDKKDSFKGGSFIAWLMIITRNHCLLHKRSRKFTEEVTEQTLIEDRNEDFLFKESVQKAVALLPDDYKNVVELKYFDDFSYEEIAKMLEISISLVKVRLFRAKKLLMENLKPMREFLYE